MNPEELQPGQSADKSAAALSFATMLSEKVMKAQNPMQEGLESGEKPSKKTTPPPEKKGKIGEGSDIGEIVREAIKTELAPLKKSIEDILNEDESKE